MTFLRAPFGAECSCWQDLSRFFFLSRRRHDPVVPADLGEVDVERVSLAILPALDSLPGLLSLLLPELPLHVLGLAHRTATAASRGVALLLAPVKVD